MKMFLQIFILFIVFLIIYLLIRELKPKRFVSSDGRAVLITGILKLKF